MNSRRLAGLLLIPLYAVILLVLAILEASSTVVFEPPYLLPVVQTCFVSFTSIAAAYVSGVTYIKHRSPTMLFLGTGVLSFGIFSLFAAWLIDWGGANVNVTIFNIGALLAASLHATSASTLSRGGEAPRNPGNPRMVITAYSAVIISGILVSAMAMEGWTPTFFVQGMGPTLLRQVILGTGTLLFGYSSIMFARLYRESRSGVLYWYSLALVFIAMGMLGIFVQKAVGSPIGWMGRTGYYIGGIYFLLSVLSATRSK